MTNSKTYQVKLMIEFPFECQVQASSEKEAIDIALDNAMDYLEGKITDSHKFDEFWEYVIKHKVLEVQ